MIPDQVPSSGYPAGHSGPLRPTRWSRTKGGADHVLALSRRRPSWLHCFKPITVLKKQRMKFLPWRCWSMHGSPQRRFCWTCPYWLSGSKLRRTTGQVSSPSQWLWKCCNLYPAGICRLALNLNSGNFMAHYVLFHCLCPTAIYIVL